MTITIPSLDVPVCCRFFPRCFEGLSDFSLLSRGSLVTCLWSVYVALLFGLFGIFAMFLHKRVKRLKVNYPPISRNCCWMLVRFYVLALHDLTTWAYKLFVQAGRWTNSHSKSQLCFFLVQLIFWWNLTCLNLLIFLNRTLRKGHCVLSNIFRFNLNNGIHLIRRDHPFYGVSWCCI